MWSAAPGIYAEYDYEDAAEFNQHTLPRQISIFEGGALVVQARVESFGEPGEIDPNAFKPGPGDDGCGRVVHIVGDAAVSDARGPFRCSRLRLTSSQSSFTRRWMRRKGA